MKHRRQHATLTLIDTDKGDGYTAKVTYQPSLKGRKENSPCVNAMIRLCLIVQKYGGDLGAPLQPAPPPEPEKEVVAKNPLTFWEKIRKFLSL